MCDKERKERKERAKTSMIFSWGSDTRKRDGKKRGV